MVFYLVFNFIKHICENKGDYKIDKLICTCICTLNIVIYM